MSWNILNGGLDGDDAARSVLQMETIVEVGPDVLMIQEAKGFESDGGRRLYEMERRLGMRGFLAVAPHTGQNTAVFARSGIEPMSFVVDDAHFHHAAAFATLRVPGCGMPVTFVSVHLCPSGVPMRLIEAAILAPLAAPGRCVLVAGDFNSVSPLDAEPDWSGLSPHHRTRYTVPDGSRADLRVLETLYGAGFHDVAHGLSRASVPTVPGAAFPETEFVPFRADYVLATATVAGKAVSYSVVRNEATDRASDHSIVADFDLSRGEGS